MEPLKFMARKRIRHPDGAYEPELLRITWDPTQTALVICDMWAAHWCVGATERVAELAPRINEFAACLRTRDALVFHCPSRGMEHYEGTPMRLRAQNAPQVPAAVPFRERRPPEPEREGPFPIDDSDGGCFCTPPCARAEREKFRSYREHPAIEIAPEDAISESREVYDLMRRRGITNVLVTGVHINMCVLNRPFAIRQMVDLGQDVVLVRDLTDSMYNPAMPPRVSHFRGTEMVVEHIEKYWCASTTSAEFLGGRPFRFAADTGA